MTEVGLEALFVVFLPTMSILECKESCPCKTKYDKF